MKDNPVQVEKKSLLQFIKFGLVGALNTLVDFLVYTLLVLIFSISKEQTVIIGLFTLIAYACGVLNSFMLNTRWTFKQEYKKTNKELIRFIIVNLITWGMSFMLVKLFSVYVFADSAITRKVAELIGYSTPEKLEKVISILSKLLSAPITIIVNFLGSKLFVFKAKKHSEE